MPLSQTLKNINRTQHILRVLFKYGFEDALVNGPLSGLIPERGRFSWQRNEVSVKQFTRWERIRMVAEELGPTFIKLGQVLSNRPDLLPEPLIKELQKLQSEVPPIPFEEVRKIVRSQMGDDVGKMFEFFDETPIGSASIGQVHKARLVTGQDVVVKVQRPGVDLIVDTDLSIIKELVRRSENYLEQMGLLNPMDVVDAFDRTIRKELDYKNEARNIEQFRLFYLNTEKFYIPRAYKHLSTEKVLIIEYADGCKINNVKQLRAWGLDPRMIAERGMDVYLTQIFEFGYFHGDPHPGNVLVREDGTICLIDFGMVGKLVQRDKYNFAGVFFAMANQDARQMAINLRRLAVEDRITDMRQLEYALTEIIDDYSHLDVSESSIAELFESLQSVMYDFKIRVPGSIFIIFRAMAILEGIGKTLHPSFRTDEFLRPYGEKVLKERYSIENIYNDLSYRASDVMGLLASLPSDLRSIIKQIRRGEIKTVVEHTGYNEVLMRADRMVNRMILAVLIFAFVTASSIVLGIDLDPPFVTADGIPIFSLIGYSIAGFLCLVLLIAIWRSRRRY